MRLVLVVLAVEPAIKIILILAPRHAGHKVNHVTLVPPRLDPLRHVVAKAVNDGRIGLQIQPRTVGHARLKHSPLLRLGLIDCGLKEGQGYGEEHGGLLMRELGMREQ